MIPSQHEKGQLRQAWKGQRFTQQRHWNQKQKAQKKNENEKPEPQHALSFCDIFRSVERWIGNWEIALYFLQTMKFSRKFSAKSHDKNFPRNFSLRFAAICVANTFYFFSAQVFSFFQDYRFLVFHPMQVVEMA